MAKTKPSSATTPAWAAPVIGKVRPQTIQLIDGISKRYGITPKRACDLLKKYKIRQRQQAFVGGWWFKLLDAQFQTHIGPYKRIRCGREKGMSHLTPDAGQLCHDCGCA